MKSPILSSLWLRAIIAVSLVAIGWMLLVYAADWPVKQEFYYACPLCRAERTVSTYFMIPFRERVNDNEFSRYYRNNADPQHQHIWLGCGVSRTTRTSDISAHGAPDLLRLHYKAALAIIKSLPDRKTRKAFFEHLYVPDRSLPEAQRVLDAIWKLNDAYWANEHRRDWVDLLQKMGLYPKATKRL